MTDKQDPIAHAARLLREAAEELRQAHAYSNSEGWENETDAKAAYDEHLAAAQALEDWEAAVGAGGVQALSAAPADVEDALAWLVTWKGGEHTYAHAHASELPAVTQARVMGGTVTPCVAALTASPTPPAEQQAPKETLGGVNGWRDISTAPKDGSRFVATGHNYGLYSEVRHTCVAQWFRGCWMEASDWNETSELKYLTHWMPLPSPPDDVAAPAEQQAAPKAAPGDVLDEALRERDEAEDFINELLDEVLGADRPEWSSAYNRYDAMSDVRERITALHKPAVDKAWGQFQSAMAAPQQEAQEPSRAAKTWCSYVAGMIGCYLNEPDESTKVQAIAGIIERRLWALPTPQPAPDCHHRPPCNECAALAAKERQP